MNNSKRPKVEGLAWLVLFRNIIFIADNPSSATRTQNSDPTVYKFSFRFLTFKLKKSNLDGSFATFLLYFDMDTSIQVLRHLYLARFLSSRRQADNNKRNIIANEGKGVHNQNF